MKNVGILTTQYPYGRGEQFLEQEILFWGMQTSLRVILFPHICQGLQRNIPSNITLDKNFSFSVNYFYFFILIFQSFFLKEIFYLSSSRKFSIINLMRAVKFGILIYMSHKKLKKSKFKCDLYYSYWSDFSSYGALLLKKKNRNIKVVTRMHGYDLYENLYSNNYMPYKRQFIDKYDEVLVLSDSAKKYLIKNFSCNEKKIKVIPLGVFISKDYILKMPEKNILKIVTISNCIKIKRIDKIIDAISLVSQKELKLKIIWHHYGEGILKQDLENKAREKLNSQLIEYNFEGQLDNSLLQKKISENAYDLIINSSESEGIPVSLMEAMSKFVVPIAPDIGGIKHLVEKENGYLISNNAEVEEICNAIIDYLYKEVGRKKYQKESAYYKVKKDFNSEVNYIHLIKIIEKNLEVKS